MVFYTGSQIFPFYPDFTYQGNLFDNAHFTKCAPFPMSLPHCSLTFPGITSQMNNFYSNPFSGLASGETQTKTNKVHKIMPYTYS